MDVKELHEYLQGDRLRSPKLVYRSDSWGGTTYFLYLSIASWSIEYIGVVRGDTHNLGYSEPTGVKVTMRDIVERFFKLVERHINYNDWKA